MKALFRTIAKYMAFALMTVFGIFALYDMVHILNIDALFR